MADGRGSHNPSFHVEPLTPTGNSQATAAVIKGLWSPAFVIGTGNNLNGYILPPASKGKMFAVMNLGPTGGFGGLNVYPAVGGQINALGTNNPLLMTGQSSALFIAAQDGLTWYTVPQVPS